MKQFVSVILLIFLFGMNVAAQEIDCDSTLEIWEIQGQTDIPNCLSESVITTENIVTALSAEGFFMQTAGEGDGDPLTSDGIYVFTGFPPIGWGVDVGHAVSVDGRVKEFYNFTRLEVTGQRRITIVSEGNPLPEPINLYDASLEYLEDGTHPMERYEGMRVTLTDAIVTAPTNQFDEFGVTLTGERSFREPGIEADMTPSLAGLGLPEWDLNPELFEVDPPELEEPAEFLLPGSVITTITGPVGYTYQDYQIWPTELEYEAAEPNVRSVRDVAEGEFTIATQNMENLFDITDDPDRDDSSFEDYVPVDAEQYAIRLRKASEQVRVMLGAPDIVALQEVENTRVIADLIQQIQTDDPSLTYYGCLLEGNDNRGIDNAYLVRVDRVTVYDCYSMPGSVSALFQYGGTLYGRPPLILEVDLLLDDGGVFPMTLVNLHIKSLSGIETDDTQLKRYDQAIGISQYLQSLFDEDEDANIVVLGDLNAFQFTDGIVDVVNIISGTSEPESGILYPEEDTLEPDLINQINRLPQEEQYSYIYNGSLQILDHILTSPSVDEVVSDVMYSRGNADGFKWWYWEDNGAQGVSDHDGLVLYISP